jgi:hypothetical protein
VAFTGKRPSRLPVPEHFRRERVHEQKFFGSFFQKRTAFCFLVLYRTELRVVT